MGTSSIKSSHLSPPALRRGPERIEARPPSPFQALNARISEKQAQLGRLAQVWSAGNAPQREHLTSELAVLYAQRDKLSQPARSLKPAPISYRGRQLPLEEGIELLKQLAGDAKERATEKGKAGTWLTQVLALGGFGDTTKKVDELVRSVTSLEASFKRSSGGILTDNQRAILSRTLSGVLSDLESLSGLRRDAVSFTRNAATPPGTQAPPNAAARPTSGFPGGPPVSWGGPPHVTFGRDGEYVYRPPRGALKVALCEAQALARQFGRPVVLDHALLEGLGPVRVTSEGQLLDQDSAPVALPRSLRSP